MIRGLAALAALSLLAGCGSGDDGDEADERPDVEDVMAEAQAALDREAPGVTADAIRIGVTYVDTEAIRDVIDLDHGDYEATYRALFEDLNTRGGINGRRVEPVFHPVSPLAANDGEVACAQLTAEGVFAVMGFFQADALPCYLEDDDTALVGGPMTHEQLERADPPWFSADPGSELGMASIRSFAEAGLLGGRLGVVALTVDQEVLGEEVLPLLDELGIEPAASGLLSDRSDESSAAAEAATTSSVDEVVARFDDAGVESVLVIGAAGGAWTYGLAQTDYRPRLLYTALGGVNAYVDDDSSDVSLLEGAIAGGMYDGEDIVDLPAMQDCLGVIEAAGVPVLEPEEGEGGGRPYTAAAIACRNVALFRAIATAAGPELNYGSFRRAGEGLGEVTIPGYPDPFRFGPPPSADGDPPVYQFQWDGAARAFRVRPGG